MKIINRSLIMRKKNITMNVKFRLKQVVILTAALLVASLSHAQLQRSDIFYPKHGLVIGKTVVLDPDSQQPILVIVDSHGEQVEEIGPQISPYDTMTIWNADIYRAEAERYTKLIADFPDLTQGHCIVSIENYGSEHCGEATVTVAPATPEGEPEDVEIEYPSTISGSAVPIADIPNVKYVVLRNSSTITDPRLLDESGPVLFVSRINLNNINNAVVNDASIRSLLMTEAGDIERSTEHNITYKTGYFEPTEDYDENRASGTLSVDKPRALGPIAGAKVFSAYDIMERYKTYTDDGGAFRIEYYLPPCPCFTFMYDGDLWAEIPYKNYNPLNSEQLPFASFFASAPTSDVCSGYHYCWLVPDSQKASVAAAHATIAYPAGYFRRDIKFDAMIITGEGELVDEEEAPISVGQMTSFSTEMHGDYDDEAPGSLAFDFDLDRQIDQAVLHNDEYYIYLGGRDVETDEQTGDPINEDFRRLPDQINDYEDRGLLEEISIEDLKETDLYIYRVSTGELIVERENLKPEEYARLSSGGVGEDATEGSFFYRQLMRGPRLLQGALGNQLSNWWSDADIKIELFDNFQADFLRMGEEVRIIAINRPTGYIGSTIAKLEFNTETGTNTLDVPIDKIKLRAPNLKVRAERATITELGLSASDEINEYLIGSEGAGLVSDEYIAIKTEWFDYDGRPLPSDLPGYSGTLAKIVGSQTLANDSACTSSAEPITIQPGSRFQLLKIGDECDLGTEHYYVYVCGHNKADAAQDKCFSFNNTNDIGRPGYYVPVKVPFYDELASRQQYNAYRYAKEDDIIPDDAEEPDPIYRWHYRPEMQFSVFDLDVDEVRAVREGGEGAEDIIDILDNSSPVIGSTTDYIDLVFSLIASDGIPLTNFGPDRELVLAFGENEVTASIGEDQTLRFENLDHVTLLDPEDFLSIRLYTNNDSVNVLWEYAFEFLEVNTTIVDTERWVGDCFIVSADESEVSLYSVLIGYGFREPEQQSAYTISWAVEGDGSLDTMAETVDEHGFTSNNLVLPPVAGAKALVKGRLSGTNTETEFGDVCVVAGVPYSIGIDNDGSNLYYGSANERIYTITVNDRWGNPVENGTVVDFDAVGDIELSSDQSFTENGVVTVGVSATEKFDADNLLEVSVGSYVVQSVPVAVSDLSVSIDVVANAELGDVVPVTVSVSPPSENVVVSLYSDVGIFEDNFIETDSLGQIQTNIKTSSHPKEGEIIARVGLSSYSRQAFTIGAPDNITIAAPVMIGDVAVEGSTEIVDDFGFAFEAYYSTYVDVEVTGTPGEIVGLSLGSRQFPVEKELLKYPMNLILDNKAYDWASGFHARPERVRTVSDSPEFSEKSFRFGDSLESDGSGDPSFVILEDVPGFSMPSNDWRLSMSVKPDAQVAASTLVSIQGALVLSLSETNELTLTVNDGIEKTVSLSTPLTPSIWQEIDITMDSGSLTLEVVGGETQTLSGIGNLNWQASSSDLLLGEYYVGLMSDLTLYEFGAATNSLAVFEGGAITSSVEIGAGGTSTVRVLSTGRLNSNASKQQVDLMVAGKSYPIYVISRSLHSRLVSKSVINNQAYIDTLLTADDLSYQALYYDINFARPVYAIAFYFSRDDFLALYEGGRDTLLKIAGPFGDAQFWEDIGDGFKQLGEEEWEAMKDNAKQFGEEIAEQVINGEVDEVTAAILLMRVAMFVPIVRRYIGRAVGPLINFLKRYGDRPIAKHVANALLKVLKPALKGDFDPLLGAVYGLIFIADITEFLLSGEAAEFEAIIDEFMNSIDSADDLLGIFSFARLALENLDVSCTDDLNVIDAVETSDAGKNFLAKEAYAGVGFLKILKRIKIKDFLDRLKKARGKLDLDVDPDKPQSANKQFKLGKVIRSIGDAMAVLEVVDANGVVQPIADEVREVLENILDERTLLVAMVVSHREGPAALKAFLSNKLPLRTKPIELIAAIAKIETAVTDGQLDTPSYSWQGIGSDPALDGRMVKWKIRDKYKNVFIRFKEKKSNTPANQLDDVTPYVAVNKMNGDAFHLVKIASLLAEGKTIVGVEANTKLQFKKESVSGSAQNFGKALDRRVDTVVNDTASAANATWHEVKSLAFNTKRRNKPTHKRAFRRALGKLDIKSITSKNKKITGNEVLGEDSITLTVRSNQFYAKEFFVDRVYAGSNIGEIPSRMRWTFQDFYFGRMNEFDSKSASQKRSLVVFEGTFSQCGINSSTGGNCSSIFGSSNPLQEIREKLSEGIKSESNKDVIKVTRHTFRPADFDDEDDVKSYIEDFKGLRNTIMVSENANDWILQNPDEALSAVCELQ